MKENIIRLVDSIEGYGNIIVTKPDGNAKKYPFKNTITEHFRKNLMNAILYGDNDESVDDWSTADQKQKGYYYSNKMLSYRFRVKVGKSTGNGSSTNQNDVKNGIAKQLIYTGDVGETRYGLIGYVNADQATISDHYGSSPIHFSDGYNIKANADVNLEEIDGFEESQNVFVGNQLISGGVVVPIFRPARENLRWANISGSTGVPTAVDATAANIRNINLDTPSALIAPWDSYQDSEIGVQATVRQTIGPAPWQVGAFKTSDIDLVTKYTTRLYYRQNPDQQLLANSDVRQLTAAQVNALWFEGEKGVLSRDDYYSGILDAEDSEHFYPHSWDIGQPQSPYYWSFVDNVESWSGGNAYLGRDTDNLIGNGPGRHSGKILGIEVQNFPIGNSPSETLAYHIPTTNIEIDRNDNVTVEYNFKFTKPTSSSNLNWNIAYIDELSRAINPITQDETIGVKSLFTNRAKQIQLTGAAVFEEGVRRATVSETKVPTYSLVSTADVQTGGDRDNSLPDDFGNSPPYTDAEIANNTAANNQYKWREGDKFATSDANKAITSPAWPTTIRKMSPQWGGDITYNGATATDGVDIEYNPADPITGGLTQLIQNNRELHFWRIMTSAEADKYCYESVPGNDTWTENFQNVNVRHDVYTDNIQGSGNSIIDKRSYYNQVNFMPGFDRVIAHHDQLNNSTDIADRNLLLKKYMWLTRYKSEDGQALDNTGYGYDKSIGNLFDYFKNMLSERGDVLGNLTWDNGIKYIGSYLSYDGRKCQIWFTPYGTMSYNIVEHAKRTDWLGDTDYYSVDGNRIETEDVATTGDAMLNVDTIWQHGVRLVDPSNIYSLTPAEAILRATNLLLPSTTDEGNSSYLVRVTDSGEGDDQSKINFKVTTDGHMKSPPRFFKTFYGSDGHPAESDFKDTDIESYWVLKENWRDILVDNFREFRSSGDTTTYLTELDNNGSVSTLQYQSDEEYFSDVYETFAQDMYPTTDGGYFYANETLPAESRPEDVTQVILDAIKDKTGTTAAPKVVFLQVGVTTDGFEHDSVINVSSDYDAHNTEPINGTWQAGERYVYQAGYRRTRFWEVDDEYIVTHDGGSNNTIVTLTEGGGYIEDLGLTHDDILGTMYTDYRAQKPIGANPLYWVQDWATALNPETRQVFSTLNPQTDRIVLMTELDTKATEWAGEAVETQLVTTPAQDFVQKWSYEPDTVPFGIEVTNLADTANIEDELEPNMVNVEYWGWGSTSTEHPRGNLDDATSVYVSYTVTAVDGDNSTITPVGGGATETVNRWTPDGYGRTPSGMLGWHPTVGGTYAEDEKYYKKTSYTALQTVKPGIKVHSELKELYRPKMVKGTSWFGIPSKIKMVDDVGATLSDDEEAQALYRWILEGKTHNPLGADIKTVVETLRGSSQIPRDDRTLKQLLQYHAPYGFIDLYQFHDGTPATMKLAFPNPKKEMFYGIIDNPGGTGEIGVEDPLMTNPSTVLASSVDRTIVANDTPNINLNLQISLTEAQVIDDALTESDIDTVLTITPATTFYTDADGVQTFSHDSVIGESSPDASDATAPATNWAIGDYYVISTYQQSDPTWTKGDKVELTWSINPPVSGSV